MIRSFLLLPDRKNESSAKCVSFRNFTAKRMNSMLSFTPLTLSEYSSLRAFFTADKKKRRTCDYTAGTTFMWRRYFQTEYAVAHDTLLLRARYFDSGEMYTFPVGQNPERALITLRNEFGGGGMRFCFTSSEDLPALRAAFDTVEITEEKDWADYLYDKAAFESVQGKRYHGQRNFISRFRRTYPEAALLPITPETISAARAFIVAQYARVSDGSSMAMAEHEAILELFDNYELYGVRGALLTVGENVVGVTVGDIIGDTLYVHVEKADTSYVGAYPMLSTAFASSVSDPAVLYINREEDMGDEGLRRAKQSWHPIRLIPKYTVICK